MDHIMPTRSAPINGALTPFFRPASSSGALSDQERQIALQRQRTPALQSAQVPGMGAMTDRERQLATAHAAEVPGMGALTERERWLIANAHRF
jgi:hypothetical protein